MLSNYKVLECLSVIKNPEFPDWQNRHYFSNPLTDMAQIQHLGYKGECNPTESALPSVSNPHLVILCFKSDFNVVKSKVGVLHE